MELAERFCNLTEVPLKALGFKSRDLLSNKLDKIKVLPSPEGLPRDYRGLAEISGVSCNDARNPTLGVISLWLQCDRQPSFQDLVDSLGRIDRWDVLDDVRSLLEIDAFNFSLKNKQNTCDQQLSTPDNYNVLTCDDEDLVRIGLPPGQRYDAYLLYSDRDEDIARLIVDTLESPPYRLKLCLKDRDILPGAGFEHEAITYLISERCNRLIVVLTPDFINCPAEKFIYNYTIAVQLSERSKKIVPCIFKLSDDENLNQKMRKITYSAFPLNFVKRNPFRNNWETLCNTIAISRAPFISNSRAVEAPVDKLSSKFEEPVKSKNDAGKLMVEYSIEDKPRSEDNSNRADNNHSSHHSSLKNSTSDQIPSVNHCSSNDTKVSLSSESAHSTAHLLPSANGARKTTVAKIKESIKSNTIVKNLKKKMKKKKSKKIAEALPS